jgi:drug/metabolite transporter (DMT)-like permease
MKFPPQLLLVLATVLWGGNFVIGRAVSSDIPPMTLALLRWAVALLIFFPVVAKKLKNDWPKLKANYPAVLIMAITGVAAFNTLVYVGVHYTTSINASLMNSTTPIFIYILSFIFLKDRLNWKQIVGTVISLVGVLFILTGGSFDKLQSMQFNKGDLIVIVAVLCWSIYSIVVKRNAGKLPGDTTFFATIVIGFILLTPFASYELGTTDVTINWSFTTIVAIIYVGTFASIVAFLCWNKGVIAIGANRASIFLNFIPLFATLFAVLFIDETPIIAQLVGGVAIIIGVMIASRK